MRRIKKFGIYQTAKVAAVIYFFLGLVIVVPMFLFMSAIKEVTDTSLPFFGGAMMFLIPFFYALIGFIFTAIGCAIYNVVARWTGGIEIEVEVEN